MPIVRVLLGRDEDGKRRYHNRTIRGNKKKAQKYATKIQGQVDTGEYSEGEDESTGTVAEFMAYWLDNTAARRVSEYTLADYRGMTKRYINDVLGEIRLHELEPADVQRLVTTLSGTRVARGGGPSSRPRTGRTRCHPS